MTHTLWSSSDLPTPPPTAAQAAKPWSSWPPFELEEFPDNTQDNGYICNRADPHDGKTDQPHVAFVRERIVRVWSN